MDSDESNYDYTVTLSAADFAQSSPPGPYDYDAIMATGTIFNGGYITNTGGACGTISANHGAGTIFGTGGAGSLTQAGSLTPGNWATTTASITAANPYGTDVLIDRDGITMSGETDIILGDMSLKKTLTAIEERLNILRPNKELEAEWDELRELGEKYRELEAEFTKKSKMWGILKKN